MNRKMSEEDLAKVWEEMRSIVAKSGVTIITAKESPRRKRRMPPPETFAGPNIIIVDYISRIGGV